jgi:hypothetical protein
MKKKLKSYSGMQRLTEASDPSIFTPRSAKRANLIGQNVDKVVRTGATERFGR